MPPYLIPDEREKAWHLLSILLSIGRPTCPEQLASKCQLFSASPDLVRFLCYIPGSPLCLVENRVVMASSVAVSAFGEFVAEAVGARVPRIRIRFLGLKREWGSSVRTYFRKRKGVVADSVVLSTSKRRLCLPCGNGEGDQILVHMADRIQYTSAEEPADISNTTNGKMSFVSVDFPVTKFDSGILIKERAMTPLLIDSNAEFSSCAMTKIEYIEGEDEVGTNIIVHSEVPRSVHTPKCLDSLFRIETDSNFPNPINVERVMACKPDLDPDTPICRYTHPVLCKGAQVGDIEFRNKTGFTATLYLEVDGEFDASPVEAGIHDGHAYEAPMRQLRVNAGTQVGVCGKEDGLIDSGTFVGEMEKLVPLGKSARTDETLSNGLESRKAENMITLDKDQTTKVMIQGTLPAAERAAAQKQPTKSFGKMKTTNKNALPPQPRVLLESLEYNKVVNSSKQPDQCKSAQKFISMKQKSKQSRNHKMHAKENMVDTISISPKSQLEKKTLPLFESFIIEEEEGSGGYGTVYRAQRKNDGKRFAIKCPHVNAHTHHVNNELKMLERFGGRNFIINYEGSFKSGNSECFVLEHVEHDRPEVLKREIDIFQLQWYGYCMFRALAFLHKQGVVHRDVKPGNFLFSQKLNKGYLIDFNLAMDLQQKYGTGSKSKSNYNVSFDHVPRPRSKSVPSTKDKKFVGGNILEAVNLGAVVDSKPNLELKNTKTRVNASVLKAYPDLGGSNIFRSQGADGSGLTSTKDATSTRTPSAERPREPLPCQGRKELISLVQDAMQSPNHDAVNIPASQRKRVAAPPGKVDSKVVYLSPMPLHSAGIAVAGAGLLKSKGDGKLKREGPCVGTKGFRAPEVLFRSPHQGPKVDIWSAGVSLLYLMIGRTPFVGDPDQNIKDIAKLRGSEDLWEVSKIHNRESSFPVELFNIQSLPSMELQNWCKINTKRPEFFKLIPRSLFDLVDKCLTVNPRLRISAEEALRHEFFTACHESLRKQRMLRRGLSLDSASDQSGHFVHGQSQVSVNL